MHMMVFYSSCPLTIYSAKGRERSWKSSLSEYLLATKNNAEFIKKSLNKIGRPWSNTVTTLRSRLIGAVHPVSFRSCSSGRIRSLISLCQGYVRLQKSLEKKCQVTVWTGFIWLSSHEQNPLSPFSLQLKAICWQTRGEFKQKTFSLVLIFSYTFRANKLQLITVSQILFRFRLVKPVWPCMITGIMTCFR